MRTERTHCKARTKSGKPCRAPATEGGLCFFHGNPDKAAELGRIGGRKNRHFVADCFEPLEKIETAKDVLKTAARLIADVHAGKLHPRFAAGLAPLLSLQLRAIETSSLEDRLERLEKSNSTMQTGDPPIDQTAKEDGSESPRPRPVREDGEPNEN